MSHILLRINFAKNSYVLYSPFSTVWSVYGRDVETLTAVGNWPWQFQELYSCRYDAHEFEVDDSYLAFCFKYPQVFGVSVIILVKTYNFIFQSLLIISTFKQDISDQLFLFLELSTFFFLFQMLFSLFIFDHLSIFGAFISLHTYPDPFILEIQTLLLFCVVIQNCNIPFNSMKFEFNTKISVLDRESDFNSSSMTTLLLN